MLECNFFCDYIANTHLCSSDSVKVIPMHWLVFMQLMYEVIAGWRWPWTMPGYCSPVAGGVSNLQVFLCKLLQSGDPFPASPSSCIKSYLMELWNRQGKRVAESCPISAWSTAEACCNPFFLVESVCFSCTPKTFWCMSMPPGVRMLHGPRWNSSVLWTLGSSSLPLPCCFSSSQIRPHLYMAEPTVCSAWGETIVSIHEFSGSSSCSGVSMWQAGQPFITGW